MDRPALIVKVPYGLKSSGTRFRDHVAQFLLGVGFKICLADPDLWMRHNTKPDSFKSREDCLCYVDNLLVVLHAPQKFMDLFSSCYILKEGSVKEPYLYLGARISNTLY